MFHSSIALLALTLAVAVGAGRAQGGDAGRSMAGMPIGSTDPSGAVGQGVHEQMTGMLMESAHMRMTPLDAPKPGDSARADSIVRVLKGAIAKYADYRVALADGYEIFLKHVRQKVYHFTSRKRAVWAAVTFDATQPTSLLYERAGDGYRLVGAMYTAPKRFTAEDLDARVPLSIAQWHEHVNLCVPQKGETARWRETEGGKMKFGPKGSIATKEACEASGGRWIPQLFGWMVHVNPFETEAGKVWGTHEHGGRRHEQ